MSVHDATISGAGPITRRVTPVATVSLSIEINMLLPTIWLVGIDVPPAGSVSTPVPVS